MKLGPVDGTIEEVRDLLENNGLRIGDFLEKPTTPLQTIYLIIPAAMSITGLLAVVALRGVASSKVLTLLYLLAFGGGAWLTVGVQLRYRNGLATFAAATGAFLMLMIAAGLFSLQDTADFLKALRKDK